MGFGVVGVRTSQLLGMFYTRPRWLPDWIQWNRSGMSPEDAFKKRYTGAIPLDPIRKPTRPCIKTPPTMEMFAPPLRQNP